MAITRPGTYYDLDEEEYHADPVPGGSLSSTGVRRIMKAPAKFRYYQLHPEPPRKELEIGSAAHAKVLGVGSPFEVVCDAEGVPFDAWRSKDAKARVRAIRDAGRIPVKPDEAELVDAMAEAVLANVDARALLESPGAEEVSLFGIDDATGVWKRGRVDFLGEPDTEGWVPVVDYKTTKDAHPAEIEKALFNYGYYQQAPWYLDLAHEVGPYGPGVHPVFAFIFQEKEPPYLCTVAAPEPDAIEWGRIRNRKAIDRYRQCVEADEWPGYAETIVRIGLPRWAAYQLDAEYRAGLYTTTEDREDTIV